MDLILRENIALLLLWNGLGLFYLLAQGNRELLVLLLLILIVLGIA